MKKTIKLDTLTFGPVSVLPQYQRKGVGSALIKHTIEIAKNRNYAGIIIYGHPSNYCKHGFKSSKDYNISNSEGKFPYSLLVLELQKDVFENHTWKYCESDVYNISEAEAEEYDKKFPQKVKEYKSTQEEFYIACRAFLESNCILITGRRSNMSVYPTRCGRCCRGSASRIG